MFGKGVNMGLLISGIVLITLYGCCKKIMEDKIFEGGFLYVGIILIVFGLSTIAVSFIKWLVLK